MDNTHILLERHGTHRGGDEHLSASIEVIAVPVSPWQSLDNKMHPFQRDAIAHWVKNRTRETLNTMSQCISPGGRSQLGRQAASQLRIENDEPGKQFRMKKD